MNKNETQLIKGVAIFMMIFGHLFFLPDEVSQMHHFVTIDGEPLVRILLHLSSPVHIFLMLGGYGMYRVWQKGDRNRWRRIARLMVHYWIILIAFLTLGHFIKPDVYPGELSDLAGIFSGLDTSLNKEMWFLLPYIVLGLISPWIFRFTRRIPWYILLSAVVAGYMCYRWYFDSKGWWFVNINLVTYNLYRLIQLIPSFVIGAVFARESFIERIKAKTRNIPGIGYWSWAALVGCMILCCLGYSYCYPYAMVCLLVIVPIPMAARRVLIELGNRSTDMWMTHTWFCYYLFHDEIYGLKYPLVILLVEMAVTYASGVLFGRVSGYVLGMLYPAKPVGGMSPGGGLPEKDVK